jgi:curli biogenesis system outer membrane secretion channel CsgG
MAFTTNNETAKVKEDAVTVRELVESRMVASGKYQVISRQEIDRLLENQRIQASDISSKENITKLQLQNISYIVTGINHKPGKFRLAGAFLA